MTTRFRVERCVHNLAVGLCEISTCKGSRAAAAVGQQLVAKLKPRTCNSCKRPRGDAVRRGKFYGAKANHPGYQRYLCDPCWDRIEREEAAASAPVAKPAPRKASRPGAWLFGRTARQT